MLSSYSANPGTKDGSPNFVRYGREEKHSTHVSAVGNMSLITGDLGREGGVYLSIGKSHRLSESVGTYVPSSRRIEVIILIQNVQDTHCNGTTGRGARTGHFVAPIVDLRGVSNRDGIVLQIIHGHSPILRLEGFDRGLRNRPRIKSIRSIFGDPIERFSISSTGDDISQPQSRSIGGKVNCPRRILGQEILPSCRLVLHVMDQVLVDAPSIARSANGRLHDRCPRQDAIFLMQVFQPANLTRYTAAGVKLVSKN